ncbi:hypothetical protein [uncultured Parabacteroides sp.]|uniref:hypothetical protein n=1 Tax=uncultured Parabacteroides sp. TaxID=512312 RepID=UPI0028037A90|nr:hypothetical protein [uncultured Parabacteroides sp.]
MIYIQKQMGFWNVEEVLPDSYKVGTALEDYENGAYLLLSGEQVDFHESHPDASPLQVWNMEIPSTPDPEPVPEPDALAIARQQKLQEIAEQDKFSEKFFVSVIRYQRDDNGNILMNDAGDQLTEEVANYTLWMDRSLRTTMLNTTLPAFQGRGDTTRKFWTIDEPSQEVEVPIGWAIDRIPRLEIYATDTYDLMQINKNATYAATTVEEIEAIDVKADYPHFLTFELNLDLGV